MAKMTMMMMIMVALCVLPAIVSATRPVAHRYNVRGRVYCDTCRAGFETSASQYLEGAKVKLECFHRHNTGKILYQDEATTDATGTYSFLVKEDQKDAICETALVSSPVKRCSVPDLGRDRSRVVLTSFNGIMSTTRDANNMGFLAEQPMAYCSQLMQQYKLDEDEV